MVYAVINFIALLTWAGHWACTETNGFSLPCYKYRVKFHCSISLASLCNNCQIVDWMFVEPCIIVQFVKKNPRRCNNVSKLYYSLFIWSSTCFGQHTAHHQEPKTALAASGVSYVEGCWTCSLWPFSGTVCLAMSTSYTSNNLPRIKPQRLPVQF